IRHFFRMGNQVLGHVLSAHAIRTMHPQSPSPLNWWLRSDREKQASDTVAEKYRTRRLKMSGIQG
ncbi:MAG: hypothetical protein ACOC6S_03750, partial [Chloroflexota bacterium]